MKSPNITSVCMTILAVFLSAGTLMAQLKPITVGLNNTREKALFDQAMKTKNYTAAQQAATDLYNRYYKLAEPYHFMAQASYSKGDKNLSVFYSLWALGLYSYNVDKNYNGILHSMFANDKTNAKLFLRNMQSVGVAAGERDYYLKALNDFITWLDQYPTYRNMTNFMRGELATHKEDCQNRAKETYLKLGSSLSATGKQFQENSGAQKVLNDWIAAKPSVENGTITREVYADALDLISSLSLSNNWQFCENLEPYQQEIVFDRDHYILPSRYRIFERLTYAQALFKRWDKLKSSSNFMLSELRGNLPSITLLAKPYYYLIMAETELGNYQAASLAADAYLVHLPKLTDPELVAEAYYVILRAYAYNKDIQKGQAVLKKAKEFLADPELAKQPYAMNVKNGISTTSSILDSSGPDKKIELTDNHYNNGTSLMNAKDLPAAAKEFELAKKETVATLEEMTPLAQRGYVETLKKTNAKLASIYYEIKEFDKIYDVIESNRAYSLVNNKRSNKKQVSLKELQAQLAPDEAYLSFIDVTNGFTYDGTFMMCLVKKNKVFTRYSRSAGPFTNILKSDANQLIELEKERASRELRSPNLTYLTGAKERKDLYFGKGEFDLMVEYLKKHLEAKVVDGQYVFYQKEKLPQLLYCFYNDFINGLEEELVGINKITISPEGVTSLIPFDALMDHNGKYMASRFEIGYIPNAAMLVGLRTQPKRTYPKNILAFGGATYELHGAKKAVLKSSGDLEALRYKVSQSIEKNEPLDYAFASFQGNEPMGFLQGGRDEVVIITKNIPNSEARLDDMMTENELKRMSKQGELANYKAIHLSSHASVHPYVFDLSSFAMSVASDPVNGEDGMIVVSEMEQLNMPVDFVMLSACQTALGMESPGDGVRGLNQALFNAGANSTLTSLWSVSDSGTAYLSVELYDRMFNKNLPTTTALAQVKRNFIAGKYGEQTHPYFWAPFIYTGY